MSAANQPFTICMPVRALPMHRHGGLEYHTLDLANALARRGHRLVLLTTAAPGTNTQEGLADTVTVRHVPGSQPGDYTVSFFRQLPQELLKLHQEFNFDLVHAQDFAGLLIGELPIPLVTTIHGTLTSETPLDRRYMRHLTGTQRLQARWRYKARLALRRWYDRMIRRSDVLVVDSDYTRREILLEAPEVRGPLNVIPLGIDFERYPPAEGATCGRDAARALCIGLLGRLQEMKGIGQAIGAAAALRDRGVVFRMQIAGTGDFEAAAARMIAERGLSSVVHLPGRIPNEALGGFFAECDVFLFPDLTQPAFGLVALEAMHYGVPVVAAWSGAIPEVVDESSGWLYDPWDTAGLAALLSRVLANPDEITRRAQGAATRAVQFSAARMAEQVEAVYRRRVRNRGGQ